MRRRFLALIASLVVVAALSNPARAQFVVFDPSNYAEAIAQVVQLIKEYEFLIQQAQRLPVDMYARYHLYTPGWPSHDLQSVFYAGALLNALNNGDPGGASYRSTADRLDSLPDVAPRLPDALRDPLATQYANIELGDAVATMSIDQVGQMRETTNMLLQVIDHMEADAFSGNSSFQTQAAILNKINAATVLALRVNAQNHEVLGDTLEQLVVENKRRRDAETRVMNATINQWRYGQSYGQDMFSRTAADVDSWHPF
jgi:hypothetical protein